MATITEDYVSFEIAKLLREKGFDWDTYAYYEDENNPNISLRASKAINWNNTEFISKPTHQMAMKWLREVHNIDIDIETTVGMLGVKVYVPHISTYEPLEGVSSKVRQIKRGIHYKDDRGVIPALQYFDSYEEACEAAIKYCLDNLI